MQSNPRQKLVISVDYMSNAYALEVAKQAKDKVWGFRINEYIYHYGASAIYDLKKYGRVFADIKLHDNLRNTHSIIRTMQSAGADLVSIHPTDNIDPSKFAIGIVVVGETLNQDLITVGEDTLQIIHAHRLDPEHLAATLGIGAIDDKPLGTSGL